ncbi:MAG: PAS domain-containing protein, partial [Cyanobacteria bacterium J069]
MFMQHFRNRIRVQKAVSRDRAEAKFRDIFHANPAASLLLSFPEGQILETNAAFCALVGRPVAELIQRPIAALGVWSDLENYQQLVRRLHQSDSVTSFESSFCTQTGDTQGVLLSAKVMRFQRGPQMVITAIALPAQSSSLPAPPPPP